jgi:DNA-binding transcriptional LysR family regulator
MSKSENEASHSKIEWDTKMNLRQIEAFRTVMLAGSVTAAADLLRLTQPTVSKIIAQLERQIKLKLFDRVRGRLIPRREAHSLLQDFDKVLRALEDVGRSTRHLARGNMGHIRIASHPSMGLRFLPKAIAAFMSDRPDVKVSLNVRESSYVKEWVAGQTADIGFVSDDGPDAVGTSGVRFQDRLSATCVLPKSHLLAKKKVLHPKYFEGERFVSIGRDPTFRYLIDRAFTEAGIDRKITVETNNFATACSLVAEGTGITVVDPYSAHFFHGCGGVVLRSFNPEITFIVNVIRPANQPVPLIVEEFLAHASAEQRHMERLMREILKEGT